MKLLSYASGDGALSFTYVSNGKSVGSPETIGEVANTEAWKDIQANHHNFDHLLQNFGSEKYPQIQAFQPVQRLSEDRLRIWAYGKFTEVRYVTILRNYHNSPEDWCTGRYEFWFTPDGELAEVVGQKEQELKNLSIRAGLTFYLNHEEKCIEAMELQRAHDFVKSPTYTI